jgi:hypothetical protein
MQNNDNVILFPKQQQEAKELLQVPAGKNSNLKFLIDAANEIQNECEDHTISCVKNFKDGNPNLFVTPSFQPLFKPDGKDAILSNFTPYSMSQLCVKLGIPTRYIHKCLENGRADLAADNINSWVEDYDRGLFVRMHQGRIRGILSDRYSVLDVPDVLNVLGDVMKDTKVKSYYMSPERFHLRIITDKLNVPGEDLFAGLQVDTSDVGRSLLVVKYLVYKQVCSNGMCVNLGDSILFQQKHVGISSEEFHDKFGANALNIDALNDQVTALICDSQKVKFTKEDLEKIIGRMWAEIKTPFVEEDSPHRAKLYDLMSKKYGNTLWGAINSFTEVAQDFTLERRLDIEKYAGELLSGLAA